MKKFISLAMALAMTVALVPATAFAGTDASVSKTVTSEENTELDSVAKAPYLVLKANSVFKNDTTQSFRLTLENAEWLETVGVGGDDIATVMKDAVKGIKYNDKLTGGLDAKIETLQTKVNDYNEQVNAVTAADFDSDFNCVATPATPVAVPALPATLQAKVIAKAKKELVTTLNAAKITAAGAYDKANIVVIDVTAEEAVAAGFTLAGKYSVTLPKSYINAKGAALEAAVTSYKSVDTDVSFKFERQGDNMATVTVETIGAIPKDAEIAIPLYTKLTGGTAVVKIDGKNSEFSSDSKTFGRTMDGSTNSYMEKTTNFQGGEEVKALFIEEVTPGTFKADKEITVKVNSGFKFTGADPSVVCFEGDTDCTLSATADIDGDTMTITLAGKGTTAIPATLKVTGIKIDEDGSNFGKVAELTVRGSDITTQTVEVGTYVDFGVSVTAAKKDLPVIYAGTKAQTSGDYENKTLKVTIEEKVAKSIISNRKLTLELPDGVEFATTADDKSTVKNQTVLVDDFKVSNFTSDKIDGKSAKEYIQEDLFVVDGDGASKISITGLPVGSGSEKDGKRKIEVTFQISAKADFEGDVVLTVGGPAVANEKLTATIATVKAPITVKSEVNEVKIDYRNTAVGDIVITEPAAGLWAKGDIITLKAENMTFESGITAKVTAGDMTLEKFSGDYVDVVKKDGTIQIKVKNQSAKTPAEITLSGIQLYLERNLPAGDYKLSVVNNEKNDFFFNNYNKDGDDMANYFETDDITVLKDFVKVVTAGRDQNDTFTTKITVPVGKDTILAGTKEIKVDAAAYINKDGYTMLPVRAVTEALNGLAIVRWDDTTKTATISFGSRVFSMTVASKSMNMNGVNTTLLAAPEIKNSRIFLPLRDLGYALGLTDSKITWDAATATATLN